MSETSHSATQAERDAKLSGWLDGLTANLGMLKEEYECVLRMFLQANKAKREARRELVLEKEWRKETTVPFLEWAQAYLNSGRWAGHDMFDAIKTELLERDAECARLRGVERKAIEQSEYIQSHGLTEFEMARLKAERDAAWRDATERAAKIAEAVHGDEAKWSLAHAATAHRIASEIRAGGSHP